MIIDSYGILWIGTISGLFQVNPETNEQKYFQPVDGDTNSISNGLIYDIIEDSKRTIWIATAGGGISRFDRLAETFTNFYEKDGLPDNVVKAVLEDKNGILWLTTDKGITGFDPDNKKLINFNVNDGLHNNVFSRSASFITSSGELFFGGLGGLTYFHPDSLVKDDFIPPVLITDFQIFNKSVKPGKDSPLNKDISEIAEVHLSSDQNIFSLEFAALEYFNPQKIKYAYKLDGLDPDWVYTDANRRFVSYTQLDAGTYTFHVKNSNKVGIWNDKDTSLKIIIYPPWYGTNLAYIVYVILIISALYWIRRYELNRILLRNESIRLKELDKLKSRFFANISHEFRTPLTLILGPVQQFIEKNKNPRDGKQYALIQRNVVRLQRLINQLLDLSRLEAGKLKLRAIFVDIVRFTKTIVAAFESHAQRRNINLVFETGLAHLNMYIDPDKFEKIISNLLSNAFKFSEDDTEIKVILTLDKTRNGGKGQCRILIKDQGIGIAEQNIKNVFDRFYQIDSWANSGIEGSGIGLSLVKELVELHQGSISVESQQGTGSSFTILLPVGKDHLSDKDIVEMPKEEIKINNYEYHFNSTQQHTSINDRDSELPLILVVEDNKDVQHYIAGFLEKEYSLIFAENGKQGLDEAIKYIPDLIVSDVMMPGMDGFEMCNRIKNDITTSHIPLILLTARAGKENKLEGLLTGADDYLTKPFDAIELQVRIRNLIEQRKKLHEKFNKADLFKGPKLAIGEKDKSFLGNAVILVRNNLTDSSFNAEKLAIEIALSRAQLFRKIKSLTGKSTTEFIRHIRIKQAAELLKSKQGNVSEVAFQVGFNNLSYFTKNFKKQFGVLPSEYVKDI